ncbi:MAG: T9SS type A sorting domain-containing protein, partial [Bacteroidales bacterium]|nr:T9SS type A sorting domain-containing protein [Bacteroidales bacterium]
YLYFLITLASLIFFSAFTHAQNYQTFNSGRLSYFEDAGHNVKSVRIDSVHFDTDSVLFPMGNIRPIDWNCYNPTGPSWLGGKIIIEGNGQNLFFNKNNDTILITTNALLNQDWIAFQIQDSMIVKAQVNDVDTLSFLGLNDSVKFISFQVYNDAMTPVNHVLNTFEIVLSKNYGIVKTLNFYNFPDIEDCYFECEYLNEFYIIGISNPFTGVQNFTSLDIFNFQPGDELHVSEGYSSFFSWNSFTQNKISRCLARYDYSDSIFYDVETTVATWNYNDGETIYNFYIDTIVEKYYLNSLLSCFPDEAFEDGYDMTALKMISQPHLAKVDNNAYRFIFDGDDCWSLLMADGFLPRYEYYYGLGGPYYSETQGNMGDVGSRTLVYYKIGEDTWGTPLVLSGLKSQQTENEFTIYPNPANEEIRFTVPSEIITCCVEIYNLQGTLVYSDHFNKINNKIDVQFLPSGVYMLKVTLPDSTFFSKFVKK